MIEITSSTLIIYLAALLGSLICQVSSLWLLCTNERRSTQVLHIAYILFVAAHLYLFWQIYMFGV